MGSVVIITATIWIPACYFINKVDEKRRREKLEWECRDVFDPSEVERVIHVKVPRHRSNSGQVKKTAI